MIAPEEMIIRLRKLIKNIEHIQENFGDEITHSQLRVIFPIIRDSKGYTIQELSDMAGVSKGLGSRVIADLEGKGFVERDKKTENQDRNYQIILSAKGQKFVADKKMKMLEISSQLQGQITEEEFRVFSKVLFALTE